MQPALQHPPNRPMHQISIALRAVLPRSLFSNYSNSYNQRVARVVGAMTIVRGVAGVNSVIYDMPFQRFELMAALRQTDHQIGRTILLVLS